MKPEINDKIEKYFNDVSRDQFKQDLIEAGFNVVDGTGKIIFTEEKCCIERCNNPVVIREIGDEIYQCCEEHINEVKDWYQQRYEEEQQELYDWWKSTQ